MKKLAVLNWELFFLIDSGVTSHCDDRREVAISFNLNQDLQDLRIFRMVMSSTVEAY